MKLALPGRWAARRVAPSDEVPPLDTPGATRVLMVCMGNICRSPTAEGVLRAKLRQAKLHRTILVDSAGTHGYHTSEPPDPRAIAHAARRGYDIGGLRARTVEPVDFVRFHWMFAMDDANLRWLQQNRPDGIAADAPPRIGLLLQQVPGLGRTEVPDPYYGSPEGFDLVLDLIERACDGIVQRLQMQGR